MPKSFSMSVIWKILTGLLLSLSLTFTALFQNQVEWIFPAFFSWQHWFSWHMLSNMQSLPENFSWCRSSDLFWWFFQLTRTLHLSFLHSNFTITNSFFFRWWQACKSSGLTSCLVRESALQMFSSSSLSLIDGGTGFTSTYSCQWYWAFLSNWTTPSVSNLLQFLVMAKCEETTSNPFKKSLNQFDKSVSFSSINSSFESFSNWHLVRIILVEDDDGMMEWCWN